MDPLDRHWYEFWFNAWDYLFDKDSVSVADIHTAVWNSSDPSANRTPVESSEVQWGFKFGVWPPMTVEASPPPDMPVYLPPPVLHYERVDFYQPGPRGLPPGA